MVKVKRPAAFRRFMFIVFGIVCAYLLVTVITQQSYMREQELERAALQRQLDEVSSVNESLSRQLDSAQTIDAAQQIVREKLGWVRPGELIFIQAADAPVIDIE